MTAIITTPTTRAPALIPAMAAVDKTEEEEAASVAVTTADVEVGIGLTVVVGCRTTHKTHTDKHENAFHTHLFHGTRVVVVVVIVVAKTVASMKVGRVEVVVGV